jgi:hypothetical protein
LRELPLNATTFIGCLILPEIDVTRRASVPTRR